MIVVLVQTAAAIAAVDDAIHCLALVGHNPGISDFVADLIDTDIRSFRTCGVGIVNLPDIGWSDLGSGVATRAEYLDAKTPLMRLS